MNVFYLSVECTSAEEHVVREQLSGVSHYRPDEAKSLHCLLRLAHPGASADSPISASYSRSAVITDAQHHKDGWKGLDRGPGCAASSFIH